MVKWILFTCVVTCAVPRLASAEDCEQFTPAEADPASPGFAEELATMAEKASVADCLDAADRLWEGAHRVDPQPRYVYERILVRERMGDAAFAFELLDGYREDLVSDPSLTDLVDTDARLRAALRVAESPTEPVVEPPPQPSPRRAPLDTYGPIALAVGGAASLGMAAYGMSATCEVAARDGACLQGSEVAVGPTTAYAVGGVLALVGAAIWWIAAIPEKPSVRASFGTGGLRVYY